MKKVTINNRAELCEKIFGEPSNAKTSHLSHKVYKNTSCGGWLKTERWGVRIGTIVEGSDAEFEAFLRYPFTQAEWDAAWEKIEELAEWAWRVDNESDDEEQFDANGVNAKSSATDS